MQDLINQEILFFSEEKPNMKTNPFPNHGGSAVNAIIEEETAEFVLPTDDVKTPSSVVLKRLEQFGFLAGIHEDCAAIEEVAVIESITIVYRKKKVEAPPKRIQPIHFRVPSPFPYQNTKAMPWNYETITYVGGKEICIPVIEIANITGTRGMNRSGRVFTPKYTLRVSPSPTIIPHKEKVLPTTPPHAGATVPTTLNMTTVPAPTNAIANKVAESEMSKGKGSMVEDEQDITVDQFDDVVANIITNRYLGFNEAELPPEGNTDNKALHISVMCTNSLLSRVLVDTGSSLNIIPKTTLSQLQFKGPEIRTNTLIVRAFDGSRRQVIWEVDLPICVGPHNFSITFQVMDINLAYSCLLGRPWIHVAGAVTSTLHQRMKFLIDDKLVIVCGEEDILVSELSSFRYVEIDEGIVEIPLHRLEFGEVSYTTTNHVQSSATILSSVRSAKQTLEKGPLSGWG
ncbi:uncharacterized protein LOC127137279 [Lathyrus oleraceus]|uniref:uncharacterized protein LOC127137279 n=1 Tax=Pisum sativum TaxID=3888 RepID=UPI0021D1A1A4|nr:uncharacterized protein LOC127137279 [Pisum sativum]